MQRGIRRFGSSVVVACVLVGVLVACSNRESVVPASKVTTAVTAASSIPVRLAEDSFAKYFQATQEVLRNGGVDPERIQPFVTKREFRQEVAVAAITRKSGRRLVGSTSFRNFTLQSTDVDGHRLRAYVCVDNEQSKIVGPHGGTVNVRGRGKTASLVLEYVYGGSEPLLDSSKLWSGKSVC